MVDTPKSFKAVIFDLDGTLLDTLEDLAASANRVLAAHGFPTHPTDAYRYFVGDGVQTLMTRVLPEGHHDDATLGKCIEGFRSDYRENWNVTTRPYDGVPELLAGLSGKGVAFAVLSNKPDDFTRLCVDELLSGWDFKAIRGALEGVPLKPHPAAARDMAALLDASAADIVFVGDTATDMLTATSAGMFAVGALWGFRERRELLEAGAQVTIARPQQLLDVV